MIMVCACSLSGAVMVRTSVEMTLMNATVSTPPTLVGLDYTTGFPLHRDIGKKIPVREDIGSFDIFANT